MDGTQVKEQEIPIIRAVKDITIVLECLHEVYGMEGIMLLSGKSVHDTMIYPFLKMLENQTGIKGEILHENLWALYLSTDGCKEKFVELSASDVNEWMNGNCEFMDEKILNRKI